jgi:hypothetical protein
VTRWLRTEVYAKLFDRLKADDVSTIIASAPGRRDAEDTGLVNTVNAAEGSKPEGGGECPDGWYPEMEVPGWDNLCDIDYYAEPHAQPFTDKGQPRQYLRAVPFKADTWIQLTAEPAQGPEELLEGEQVVRDSHAPTVPRVDERRVDLDAGTKLLKQADYEKADEVRSQRRSARRQWPAALAHRRPV